MSSSTVDIWLVPFDYACILSGRKNLVFKNYSFCKNRIFYNKNFIKKIYKTTFKLIVSQYKITKKHLIKIKHDQFGKPYISGVGMKRLNVSFAYSNGIAVIAIRSDIPVGIDIENNLINYSNSTVLNKLYQRYSIVEHLEGISDIRLWVITEAALKAQGTGFEDINCKIKIDDKKEKIIIDDQTWKIVEINHDNYHIALASKSLNRFNLVNLTLRKKSRVPLKYFN